MSDNSSLRHGAPDFASLEGETGFRLLFGEPDASVCFVRSLMLQTTFMRYILLHDLFTGNSSQQLSGTAKNSTPVWPWTPNSRQEMERFLTGIPDICAFEFVGKHIEPITSAHQILSYDTIDKQADLLLEFLNRDRVAPEHVIIAGLGYGGLICEQAFMRLQSDLTGSAKARARLRGMLLFDTPHFRAGLVEWTKMTANSLGVNPPWLSKCLPDLNAIHNMQAKFADIYERAEREVRLACCFTTLLERSSNPHISPDFCCLPCVEAIEMQLWNHDSSNWRSDEKYVAKRLATWVKEIRHGDKQVHNPFALRSLAGSSRSNEPGWIWDSKAANYYFKVDWPEEADESAASVSLGDIVTKIPTPATPKTFTPEQDIVSFPKELPARLNQPIARRDDVLLLDFLDKPKVDFSVSRVVQNDLEHWKNTHLNLDVGGAGYKFIVREEWSQERSIEYVMAALQIERVRESLKVETPTLYVVTGVIRGAKAADSDANERSMALGFRCQMVSVIQSSQKQADGMRLAVEVVEAVPRNQSKDVEEEEPWSEDSVDYAKIPQPEMEQSSTVPKDTPRQRYGSLRRFSRLRSFFRGGRSK
ncbi:hypothetical protein EJ08DRAFT_658868 [Tothia fuscella]|uniref:Uncharacterized protein n=1 Tax=Tothia fuscella TaxID=1048955 RepID=A0A9P4U114_9PEZI|nr:hypothetical protein EJ08DRAFT_658868 [Tothia fuscella]